MCSEKQQEQTWTSGLDVVTKVTPLLKSLRMAMICAFTIGTVWTKMMSLAGSFADGVLADAILILPRSPIRLPI